MSTEIKTDTKIETKEVDCPHCKGKIDVEIQRSKPKVIIQEKETEIIKENTTHEHTHTLPPTDPHAEMAKHMPKGMNFATCKDGNCGTIVRNPNGLETSFKTCPNCGDNTNRKGAKICKTCGKKPDSKDEWNESEVKIELEEEEEYE